MTKSVKAALISALVFPGAGHFFLKKQIAGAGLAFVALGSFGVIVSNMMEKAQEITDKILSGEVPLDIAKITAFITRPPTGPDARLLHLAWAVLIVVWLLGIVDSYRVGLGQDR